MSCSPRVFSMASNLQYFKLPL